MDGMNACTPTQERPMHDCGRDIERGPAGIAGLLPRELTAAPRDATPNLRIRLCSGSGEGPTPLAAFDAALMDAGVADHNLLCLSSVIPPNAIIVREKYRMHPSDYGGRLYVVLSEMRQSEVGGQAHAGIGWIQDEDSGRGLFVELHHRDHGRFEHDLHATLESMRSYRVTRYGPVQTVIESRLCTGRPVCALVAAVYVCEPW
jgi:arginine decarboxylase